MSKRRPYVPAVDLRTDALIGAAIRRATEVEWTETRLALLATRISIRAEALRSSHAIHGGVIGRSLRRVVVAASLRSGAQRQA